ncbi:MAG TPA: hypothetical protein VM686_41230, partial [Polyangiaceae bacterium]|nr:hypothetical protein [Polyangiaceae bacterium]
MTTELVGHHPGGIDAVAVLPGGAILSAGRDGAIRRWPGGETFFAGEKRYSPGALALDLRRELLAAAVGTDVVVLDFTGQEKTRFGAMEEGVGLLHATGDGWAAGGDSARIALFDPDGSARWAGETRKFPYAFAQHERELWIACWDAKLYRLDLDSLPPQTDADSPPFLGYPANPWGPMPFYAVLALPDGRAVVASGIDEEPQDGGHSSFHLWAQQAKAAEDELCVSEEGPLHALAYDPESNTVAAGGDRGTIVRFCPARQAVLERLPLPESTLAGSFEIPNGAPFAGASRGSTITSLAFVERDVLVVGTASGALYQVRFS